MHQKIMLTTTLKTSSDLNHLENADTSSILSEVKKNGFYSAFCVNIMPHMTNHNALIAEIQHLAARAPLRVTFNTEETICVFEAAD